MNELQRTYIKIHDMQTTAYKMGFLRIRDELKNELNSVSDELSDEELAELTKYLGRRF